MSSFSAAELAKQAAARICVKKEIQSGMRIGVGSGSTVKFLIQTLKEEYSSGKIVNIQCVPTSYQVKFCFMYNNIN